jgi:hypothetical protein
MPPTLGNETLDFLLAGAGLEVSDAQKSELRTIYEHLVAMKARVRQKRGRMAEPAHTFGFADEDLG